MPWGDSSLDADALSFQPHRLKRALGGNTLFRVPLTDIVSVEVARKGAIPRKRSFVKTRNGAEARFLIPNVDDRATELRERSVVDGN